MPEQFLHGVEVLEILDGPRPIRTVASSVIGLIGTAPAAEAEVKASLTIGTAAANNGILFTSKKTGELGNKTAVRFRNPMANSATLSVSVSGDLITVNLATGPTGTVTTTGTLLIAAIAANTAANALVTAANVATSTGAGVVPVANTTFLDGGLDEAFPLNTPVLVSGSRTMAARAGATGTLANALDGILDQAGAAVVVVRVTEGANLAATVTNIVGSSSLKTGAWAFASAETSLGVRPRVLIAPGFSDQQAATSELLAVATRLRAVVIADGPNTTDAAAITYAQGFGSDRLMIVDPQVQVLRAGVLVNEPASSRVAGLIAKSDNDRGFWWSPSNQEILGISGASRPVDFILGDVNCSANLLNAANVSTIIRQNGFRLWGNRSTSADPAFAFLSVRRTADLIYDSIQAAHFWAIDRNITKTYLEDVSESVNGYLRSLKNQGAILGGKCWPDPDLNTPANIAQGKVYFNFDFTPPYPAEHIIFRAILTNDYIEELTA
jgi:phage tail sheath protein FI